METNVPAKETPVTTNNATVTEVKIPSTQELLNRASEIQETADTPPQIDPFEVSGFNRNDIEKITDPTARQHVENMAKSLQAGYNKKFQDLAEERKKFQNTPTQPQAVQWTPERIQAELHNPAFVQAAQVAISSKTPPSGFQGSSDDWSSMTDSEKQTFGVMQNQMLLQSQQLNQIMTEKEDLNIATRYRNYDPQVVNRVQQDIIQGKVQNLREYVFKAVDYDQMAERIYKLGLQDGQAKLQTKQEASTLTTGSSNVSPANEVIKQQKGESFQSFWGRIAARNMAKSNQMKTAR